MNDYAHSLGDTHSFGDVFKFQTSLYASNTSHLHLRAVDSLRHKISPPPQHYLLLGEALNPAVRMRPRVSALFQSRRRAKMHLKHALESK